MAGPLLRVARHGPAGPGRPVARHPDVRNRQPDRADHAGRRPAASHHRFPFRHHRRADRDLTRRKGKWSAHQSGRHPRILADGEARRADRFSAMSWRSSPAQALGALPLLAWGSMGRSVAFGATLPGEGYPVGTVLLGEVVTTFALVAGLCVFLGFRRLRPFTPALFPFLYAFMVWAEAPISGTSTESGPQPRSGDRIRAVAGILDLRGRSADRHSRGGHRVQLPGEEDLGRQAVPLRQRSPSGVLQDGPTFLRFDGALRSARADLEDVMAPGGQVEVQAPGRQVVAAPVVASRAEPVGEAPGRVRTRSFHGSAT